LSTSASVPGCGPALVGEDVTLIVHRAKGGIAWIVQSSVSVNEPFTTTLEIASGSEAELFVTVRFCGWLEFPTDTGLKESADGAIVGATGD